MNDMLYKAIETIDHNPELRSWYYDDFGNRIHKRTGKFVVLVASVDDIPESEPEFLQENDYSKPCDTE